MAKNMNIPKKSNKCDVCDNEACLPGDCMDYYRGVPDLWGARFCKEHLNTDGYFKHIADIFIGLIADKDPYHLDAKINAIERGFSVIFYLMKDLYK